ncbi:odorant receptor 67d-like [Drosophila elegans]|uniref:odorant receptor 67d-like n=1 Tax=Drosophila elegans TaxID=30023 RepID=UPI0007E5F97C|nr:odorant receptor 67d-like [Drosophila elegans]
MVMQFLIPGLDPDTIFGYWMLTVVHIVCTVCGFFGNFAADMYIFVFITSAPLVKNILKCKLEDLDAKLEAFNGQRILQKDVHKDIMGIINWHKNYLRLLECSERIFFIVIFVEMITSFMSNLSILYCVLIGVWPSGKIYLAFTITSFLMFSALGTVVDSSNQDCSDTIYTCRWYDLPISEQRLLLFMLRRSQSTSGLSVGKMMPLNMNTAVQISKAIYSVLMLLMSGREQ